MIWYFQLVFALSVVARVIMSRSIDAKTSPTVIDVNNQAKVTIDNHFLLNSTETTPHLFDICEHVEFHNEPNIQIRDRGITVIMKLF